MANVPTTSWSETTPAGSDDISQGDNRIRELKTQIREVVGVDHDFPSSGQAADNGQHLQVTLQEQADLGTGAVSATILGSQTVSGKGELVYTDEDDNDVQITSGGAIYALGILAKVYPVGSIYMEITGTNPATTLGFGTWTAFGAGRVPVGYDSGDTDFDTAEETGGSKTHTLSEAEMPAHTHSLQSVYSNTGGGVYGAGDSTSTLTTATGSAGSGDAHTIVQPYIVVHMWKRTA